MPDLPLLHPDALTAAQSELYDRIVHGPRAGAAVPVTDEHGHLAGPFNALLYTPVLGDLVQRLGAALRFGSSLTDRQRELATLLVAARARSTYELSAHRTLAAQAGIDASVIDSLVRGEIPDLPDPRDRAVLQLCQTLLDDPAAARETDLGPELLVELTILVGYYQLLARLLTVAGVG
jgi:4-carboxymuconolactone decarboxylase